MEAVRGRRVRGRMRGVGHGNRLFCVELVPELVHCVEHGWIGGWIDYLWRVAKAVRTV